MSEIRAWITGGTMTQAMHLSAALKLNGDQWRFVTEATQLPVRPSGALYILPGARPDVAGAFIGKGQMAGIPVHQLP